MIPATLLALVAAAAPASPPPTAGVILKTSAAGAACRTSRVDDQHVRAALFSSDTDRCPVAVVAGERIELRELAASFEAAHMSGGPKGSAPKGSALDFAPALDRLIDVRLVVQEARDMGLDQDRDLRAGVESQRSSQIRITLQAIAAQGVKPDAAEVERLYREAVREWKLKSILLEKEDVAKELGAALAKGASFDALCKKYVGEKKARGGGDAEFAAPKHMLPEIAAAAQAAKPGVVSGPIKIPAGWVFFRIDGARYPPGDAAARAQAEAQSLARKQHEAVRRFYQSLVARYAKVDEKLLKQLDLEKGGEKGFLALLDDKRVLATIAGEKPLTVGDLTTEVSQKFFHGLEGPIREKKVNREKDEAWERILGSRLFAKEAAVRKLDARPDFQRKMADYERAMLFNVFLQKVIAPDIQVSEQDAMAWYEKHKAEYTTSDMYRLEGLAYPTAQQAQVAFDKLRGGTDFTWFRNTAPGQVPPEQRKLQFDGRTVSATTLGPELRKALTGARAGEYRLYALAPTEVYVVKVVDQTPPTTQPYAEARDAIAKKLFEERLLSSLRDYAAKLRKAQQVDVLITRVAL